jgi:hypothetical protein
VTIRYRFDAGLAAPIRDAAGLLALGVRAAAGGALSTVAHGDGLAIGYPSKCRHEGDASCPRAILQSEPAGFLNPGRARLSYGASVMMRRDETVDGANVLQKGYAKGHSEFKLQVDGADGYPSCVLVGVDSPGIYVALATRTVADGHWHAVECTRVGSSLTIAVDSRVAAVCAIPETLSVTNNDPLRIGGKGIGPNNDQYTGAVDDVYVTVGAL